MMRQPDFSNDSGIPGGFIPESGCISAGPGFVGTLQLRGVLAGIGRSRAAFSRARGAHAVPGAVMCTIRGALAGICEHVNMARLDW